MYLLFIWFNNYATSRAYKSISMVQYGILLFLEKLYQQFALGCRGMCLLFMKKSVFVE